MLVAGVASPVVLRVIAQIEPLNRVAVPLALGSPWSRRKLFRGYVADLRSRLAWQKGETETEQYLALPADMQTEGKKAERSEKPAGAILDFLGGGKGAGGMC